MPHAATAATNLRDTDSSRAFDQRASDGLHYMRLPRADVVRTSGPHTARLRRPQGSSRAKSRNGTGRTRVRQAHTSWRNESDPERNGEGGVRLSTAAAIDAPRFEAPGRNGAGTLPIEEGGRRMRGRGSVAARKLLARGDHAGAIAVVMAAGHRHTPEPSAGRVRVVTRRRTAGCCRPRCMTRQETGVEHERRAGDRDGDDDADNAGLHGVPIIATAGG